MCTMCVCVCIIVHHCASIYIIHLDHWIIIRGNMRKATGKRVFQKLGEVRIRHEHGKTDRCSMLFLLLHVPLPHSGVSGASKLSKGLESSMANVFVGEIRQETWLFTSQVLSYNFPRNLFAFLCKWAAPNN